MECDRVPRRLEGRQDLKGGFECGVPRLPLLVSVAFRLTVFVDSPDQHGAVVGCLPHGILAEENGAPFLLGGGPGAPRLEQQVATACQSRLVGIPLLVARAW